MTRVWNRRRLLVLATMLFGFAGAWVGRGWLLPPLATWLDIGEPPQPVDYIMVLPGDENARPFVAAAWIRAGIADRVLIPVTTTGPDVEDGIAPPCDQIIRRVLLQRGVPANQIVTLPGNSNSTWRDAQTLKPFLSSLPPETRVAVLTSDYHTRRARWSFLRAMPEFRNQLRFASAPSDRFDPANWWCCRDGFMLITSEYVKFFAYAASDKRVLATGLMLSAGCVLLIWTQLRKARTYRR